MAKPRNAPDIYYIIILTDIYQSPCIPLYIFSGPLVQLNGLKSVRGMVASWEGAINSPVRGEEFTAADPIMIFALNVINRLEPSYDHAADYIEHLSSDLTVPTRSYFFYLTKTPPVLSRPPKPYGKTYIHQSRCVIEPERSKPTGVDVRCMCLLQSSHVFFSLYLER